MDKGQAHARSVPYGTSKPQTKLFLVPGLVSVTNSIFGGSLLRGKVYEADEASKWSVSWYQTL